MYVNNMWIDFTVLHYTGVCKTLMSMRDVTEVTCIGLGHTHLVVCRACYWIAVSGSSPFSVFTAPSYLCMCQDSIVQQGFSFF